MWVTDSVVMGIFAFNFHASLHLKNTFVICRRLIQFTWIWFYLARIHNMHSSQGTLNLRVQRAVLSDKLEENLQHGGCPSASTGVVGLRGEASQCFVQVCCDIYLLKKWKKENWVLVVWILFLVLVKMFSQFIRGSQRRQLSNRGQRIHSQICSALLPSNRNLNIETDSDSLSVLINCRCSGIFHVLVKNVRFLLETCQASFPQCSLSPTSPAPLLSVSHRSLWTRRRWKGN